jgi:thiol-disulfide isomerase/thioredoxin
MSASRQVRRLRPLTWGAALMVVIALVAWKSATWSSTEQGAAVGTSLQPGMDVYAVGERAPAPGLEGTTLDGDGFALSDWAGEVVVINVWGSWCVPCRKETPELVRLANEYADRDVQFLGINVRDNPAGARSFEERFKVPYPSLKDPDGRLLLAFRDVIPTSVVPSTVVIDRRGDVAARIIGAVDYSTLRELLAGEAAPDGGGG